MPHNTVRKEAKIGHPSPHITSTPNTQTNQISVIYPTIEHPPPIKAIRAPPTFPPHIIPCHAPATSKTPVDRTYVAFMSHPILFPIPTLLSELFIYTPPRSTHPSPPLHPCSTMRDPRACALIPAFTINPVQRAPIATFSDTPNPPSEIP